MGRPDAGAADRARVEGVVVDPVALGAELPEKDEQVRRDQRVRDDGEAPDRDVVEEREDRRILGHFQT